MAIDVAASRSRRAVAAEPRKAWIRPPMPVPTARACGTAPSAPAASAHTSSARSQCPATNSTAVTHARHSCPAVCSPCSWQNSYPAVYAAVAAAYSPACSSESASRWYSSAAGPASAWASAASSEARTVARPSRVRPIRDSTLPRSPSMREQEIRPPGCLGVGARRRQGVQRGREARRRPQVRRRRQALHGGLGRLPGGGERHRGRLPRGQRGVPLAQQLMGQRQPALGAGQPVLGGAAWAARSCATVRRRGPAVEVLNGLTVAVGEFPQQRDRLGVLRAHLRAAGQLVHHRQPLGILTAGRPQIQGRAQRAGRVPVGVDRVVGCRRRDQGGACPGQVARGEQMLGDQRRRRVPGGQPPGDRLVQRAPPRPGDGGVGSVPGQRVAERRPAVADRRHQAAGRELFRPFGGARHRQHEFHVELVAGHGGGVEHRRRVRPELPGPEQHRLPDALGYHGIAGPGQPYRALPVIQVPAQPQGGGEFLDRERDPVRAAGHRAHQVRFRFGAEQRGEDGGDAGAGERSEVDLRQLARPAQLRPGRAQAMISRQLVAAVAADQGDRAAADGAGQGREQVQRRVVRPLQIVKEHSEPTGSGHAHQSRAHRRG